MRSAAEVAASMKKPHGTKMREAWISRSEPLLTSQVEQQRWQRRLHMDGKAGPRHVPALQHAPDLPTPAPLALAFKAMLVLLRFRSDALWARARRHMAGI